MSNLMRLTLYFLLIIIFPCDAQVFQHFSKNDGAPVTTVLGITQDQEGFMWFATTRGLFRYDSNGFKKYGYQPNNVNSLPTEYTTNVFCDSNGNLWVITDLGISQYNRENDSFTTYQHNPHDIQSLSSNDVDFIAEDSKKRLWVGTARGLDQLKSTNGNIYFHNTEIKNLEGDLQKVRCFSEGNKGEHWLGTLDGLAYVPYDGASPSVFRIQADKQHPFANEINSIHVDKHDNIWIGTRSGLAKFELATKRFYWVDGINRSNQTLQGIWKILEDKHGILWIATESGLVYYDPVNNYVKRFTNLQNDSRSLIDNVLYSAYLDRQGGLWLGSYYLGISYMDTQGQNFSIWPSSKNLNPNEFLNAWIGKKNDNTLWTVSDDRKKIAFFDRKTNQPSVYNLPLISPDSYYAFYVDDDDIVWCGGNSQLTSYSLKEHKRRDYPLIVEGISGPMKGRIYNMFEDRKGKFWILGAFGLLQFNKKNGAVLSTGNNNATYTYLEDSKGTLWFGQYGKVLCYKQGRINPESFPLSSRRGNSAPIFGMSEDTQGRIWFSAQYGLEYYDYLKQKLIQLSDERIDLIEDVVADRKGYLWINAESKLVRYHPDKKSIQTYDERDGLPRNGILQPGASLKERNGNLFFVTNSGIFTFDPDKIITSKNLSSIVITSVKLFNKDVTIGDNTNIIDGSVDKIEKLTFRHDQDIFTLNFALLSYRRSDHNQYSYKLDGLEKDWNDVKVPSATYMNLPDGEYTFMVKASNGDGYWTKEPLKVRIVVLPPWWKTWWAYVYYAIIFFAVIYSITHFFWLKSSFKKENELYQAKLDFFTNISHEIRTHLSLIVGPLEKAYQSDGMLETTKKHIVFARDNAGRLMHLVSELLDFRKIQSGTVKLQASKQDIEVIIRNVLTAFEHIASEKDIVTQLVCPKETIILWVDVPQIRKVFYNLLSNAYKFTPEGGVITVVVSETPTEVIIEFTDNGPGIAEKYLKKLFTNFFQVSENNLEPTGYGIGLALSKEIIDQHHGDISVSSQPATNKIAGRTTFNIKLKKGHDHFGPDQLSAIPLHLYQDVTSVRQVALDNNAQVNFSEKKTLLLVEDNDELRAFTRECFQDKYLILEAANGLAALAMAKEYLPDVVICDVMIPSPNGLEVTRSLKSEVTTCHIPVIILTAKSAVEHVVDGLTAGADDYLTKPFDIRILELKIENLIQIRELLRQKYQRSLSLSSDEKILSQVDEEFVTKLKNLTLENMPFRNFGVSEMAYQVGMSVSVLYRKVRAVTGMTVNEFMKNVRMQRAFQLLESGAYRVNEVADMVGYEDLKYFREEFRKVYGKTPSEIKSQPDRNINN